MDVKTVGKLYRGERRGIKTRNSLPDRLDYFGVAAPCEGTVTAHQALVASRLRLDRQPEATRRAYAKEFGIALHELGLEPERLV